MGRLGDQKNYKAILHDEAHIAITYEPPKPLTENQQKRLHESTTSLQGFNIVGWAVKSLEANKIIDGLSLGDAIAYAKSVDSTLELGFDEQDEPHFVAVFSNRQRCRLRDSLLAPQKTRTTSGHGAQWHALKP